MISSTQTKTEYSVAFVPFIIYVDLSSETSEDDSSSDVFDDFPAAASDATIGTETNVATYSYSDSTRKDLLTNYNGSSITYDTIGNPTAIGGVYLSWQGRQLKQYSNVTGYTTFAYNADGVRTSKYRHFSGITTEDTEHEYILDGTQITAENIYSSVNGIVQLVYAYDENGMPVGFSCRKKSG